MSHDDPEYNYSEPNYDFEDRNDDFENPYARPMTAQDGYRAPPEGGAVILVCGILSLIACAPLGIVAWIMGNNYMRRCRKMGAPPDGVATAGRICGIVGTVIFGLQLVVFVFWVLLIVGVGIAH